MSAPSLTVDEHLALAEQYLARAARVVDSGSFSDSAWRSPAVQAFAALAHAHAQMAFTLKAPNRGRS